MTIISFYFNKTRTSVFVVSFFQRRALRHLSFFSSAQKAVEYLSKSEKTKRYNVLDIRAICLISGLLIFVQWRAFKHSFIVNSPVDKIWEFYTDIKHFEIVTPKEMKLKIINATSEKITEGSEIWVEAKLIVVRTRWHSVIRSLKPYQYLDEMVKGPFKKWTHLHIFQSINDQKQTKVLDEINFENPYGRVGKLFEGYAYTELQKLFDYRKAATIRTLQGNR